MFKREKKIESLGTISAFMNKEHHKKEKVKQDYNRANKFAIGSVFVPLAAVTPGLLVSAKSALAASPETVLNTGAEQISMKCMDYVAAANIQSVPVNVGDVVGEKMIAGLAHLFDPLIDLLIGVSFPVASALILFKLFMGFFQDQGQVWEGVGRVALVYILIQMFPVFSGILKQLGGLV
jgi:CxxC motif-containing protein